MPPPPLPMLPLHSEGLDFRADLMHRAINWLLRHNNTEILKLFLLMDFSSKVVILLSIETSSKGWKLKWKLFTESKPKRDRTQDARLTCLRNTKEQWLWHRWYNNHFGRQRFVVQIWTLRYLYLYSLQAFRCQRVWYKTKMFHIPTRVQILVLVSWKPIRYSRKVLGTKIGQGHFPQSCIYFDYLDTAKFWP